MIRQLQDTVDLQTAGDRPSDRNQKLKQQRTSVGKTVGLSMFTTAKAASHFVFICWLIIMKNEEGNCREGSGSREGMPNICFRRILGWIQLGWTQVSPLSNIKFQLFHRWGRLLGPSWCIMCGHTRVQASFILVSRRFSTPLCDFTWKAAVDMPPFSYLCLLNSLTCVCVTLVVSSMNMCVCVCVLTD